jgi:hypothetical protein
MSGKLKPFFKEDLAPIKRIKALTAWRSAVPVAERVETHNTHCSLVYKVVLDALQKFEFLASSKKEQVQLDEALETIDAFYWMMEDVREKVQKKWQAKSITNMIVQMLDYDNVHPLRVKGVVVLLKFLDILCGGDQFATGNTAESEWSQALLKAVGSCVNFGPCAKFFSEKVKSALEVNSARFLDGFSYAKRTMPQTEEETIQLFKTVLDFVKESQNFDFWINTLYEYLFPQLYPFAYDKDSMISK